MQRTLRFRHLVPIWSQLTALTLAVGMVSLTGFNPVVAQQQQQRKTLTVTGTGLVNIPTTTTQVSLGVEIQGKTAAEVQQELARRSSAVVALLRSRNVRKLETTDISVEPIYKSERGVQRAAGFLGKNIVNFRIDTELSGQLLDDAVQAGATRIIGIRFVASGDAIAAARKEAIRLATIDAQEQADAALSALHLTRQDVVNIQINSAGAFPQAMNANYGYAARASDIAVTPIVGGERQVQAFVTLLITY